MKLSVFLSSAFFAATVLAAPNLRGERRGTLTPTRTRQGGLLQHVDGPTTLDSNISNVEYSSNWAGVVLTAPPSGQTFNAVSASFTVPTPSVPSGKTGSYAASIWVGIDGDTYSKAILQVGVDVTATKSGSTTSHSYDAWYEWYPDYAYDFSGFSFTAGDVITASVVSTSSKAGTVTLTNASTGKSVSKALTPPTSSAVLGGQNAEWIVEDFSSNGGLVPFADFGEVVFINTVAKASGGTTEGASGGTIIDIKSSSGEVLTDVVINSGSEITVTYV